MVFTLSEEEIAEFQNERNARILKIYRSKNVIYFLWSICKEKHLLSSYSETVPEILQTFKEGLGEGKLVKNLEIF